MDKTRVLRRSLRVVVVRGCGGGVLSRKLHRRVKASRGVAEVASR